MCVCGGGPCRLPAPGPRPTLIRACYCHVMYCRERPEFFKKLSELGLTSFAVKSILSDGTKEVNSASFEFLHHSGLFARI